MCPARSAKHESHERQDEDVKTREFLLPPLGMLAIETPKSASHIYHTPLICRQLIPFLLVALLETFVLLHH